MSCASLLESSGMEELCAYMYMCIYIERGERASERASKGGGRLINTMSASH